MIDFRDYSTSDKAIQGLVQGYDKVGVIALKGVAAVAVAVSLVALVIFAFPTLMPCLAATIAAPTLAIVAICAKCVLVASALSLVLMLLKAGRDCHRYHYDLSEVNDAGSSMSCDSRTSFLESLSVKSNDEGEAPGKEGGIAETSRSSGVRPDSDVPPVEEPD